MNRSITVAVCVVCFSLASACQPMLPFASEPPLDLLEATAYEGKLSGDSAAAFDPLYTSPLMHAFVNEDIANIKTHRFRASRLVDKLSAHGYYASTYDSGKTQSAEETFLGKEGNCLSYTHMYVALARAAGLDARYEIVNAPPTFSASKGVLEHQVHIRVKVNLPRRTVGEQFVTVDFNQLGLSQYQGTVVSDSYALSLHYANDAVAYWQEGNRELAFIAIRRAIELAPRNADHWVNLATFLRREGQQPQALKASHYAHSLDPRNLVALAGLAALSEGEDAQKYNEVLDRKRRSNPHYQFALAKRAHYLNELRTALTFLDNSLALNPRNHEVYEFKARVETELHMLDAARLSYESALKRAKKESDRQRYRSAISRLVIRLRDSV